MTKPTKPCEPCKDTDQSLQLRSMIRIFAWRSMGSQGPSASLFGSWTAKMLISLSLGTYRSNLSKCCISAHILFACVPDGNRVASSTTIDILLRSNFTLKINEDTYNIRVPPQCKFFKRKERNMEVHKLAELCFSLLYVYPCTTQI